MKRDTAYLLCQDAESNLVYAPWLSQLEMPVKEVSQLDIGWQPPADCAILISHNQYQHAQVSALGAGMDQQIPVLILADGILEYRNSWENPQLPPGAVYRPIIGHKLACIGRSQARAIERWGNPGKCEVVGLPRLDETASRYAAGAFDSPRTNPAEEFRLLVMTARQPGFDQQQLAIVSQCLRDIRDWHAQHPSVNGQRISVQWRLTGALEDEIGVTNQTGDTCGQELLEQLMHVDAVISSPSTAALEAMLMGIPVALIDYFRCPLYVPAPWLIRDSSDIPRAVNEMANPATGKIDYQRLILADSLECESPAAPRLIKLVHQMAAIGQACRTAAQPLKFPAHILSDPNSWDSPISADHSPHSPSASAERLPDQPGSPISDEESPSAIADTALPERLRVELAHAESRLAEQQASIAEKDRRLRRSGRLNDRIIERSDQLNQQLGAQRKEHRLIERNRNKLQQRVNTLKANHRQSKRTSQDLARQTKKLSRHNQRFRQLVEKRTRQQAQLNRNVSRLNQNRKQTAERLLESQRQLARSKAEHALLSQEIEQLERHWLLGYPIRWLRGWNYRRQSGKISK